MHPIRIPRPLPVPAVTDPVPAMAYPRCNHCRQPFALRFVHNLLNMRTMKMRAAWAWLRDCERECRRKYKRSTATMVTTPPQVG